MKRSTRTFAVIRRAVIGVGAFLFGWGWVGVVPVSLPLSMPALALPTFDWLAPSSSTMVSAIPEPASWLMMIGGMLIMGAALRSSPKRRLQSAY